MQYETDKESCARADELVTYLYGELNGPEASEFESHIKACASCESDVAALGVVRSAIGAWRAETLGSFVKTLTADSAPITIEVEPHERGARRKPSAVAALREFFALAPMWLRAATAFAGLTICALAFLAYVHTTEKTQLRVVEKIVERGPSESEVEAMVNRRVEERLAAGNVESEGANRTGTTAGAQNSPEIMPVASRRTRGGATAGSSRAAQTIRSRRDRSTQDYEEIARDLQLVATRDDEEDLPRLIDLIDESN